ncbi:MAG: ParB/RepB/Spo0J family partition protein [Candidatus Omnitrophota bacterium]
MEAYSYRLLKPCGDPGKGPYALRYGFEDPALEAHVRQHGVLQPVLVSSAGEYLDGHKRSLAAFRAGIDPIPAILLSREIPRKDAFVLALAWNWRRISDELDRVVAVRKALVEFGLDKDEVTRAVLPALGVEPNHYFFTLYAEAGRVESSVLEAVHAGRFPFHALPSLLRFNVNEQKYLARTILGRAALTTSEWAQCCDWIFDLKKKGPGGIEAIFESETVAKILAHPDLQPKLKGKRLLAAIRLMRFPELSRYEKRFHDLAAGIMEGERDIRIEAPPCFEEKGYTVTARVRDSAGLKALKELLTRKDPKLNSLFDIEL